MYRKNTKCVVNDIYPNLLNFSVFDIAYFQIKSNKRNITFGPDGSTLYEWGKENVVRHRKWKSIISVS